MLAFEVTVRISPRIARRTCASAPDHRLEPGNPPALFAQRHSAKSSRRNHEWRRRFAYTHWGFEYDCVQMWTKTTFLSLFSLLRGQLRRGTIKQDLKRTRRCEQIAITSTCTFLTKAYWARSFVEKHSSPWLHGGKFHVRVFALRSENSPRATNEPDGHQ